MSNEEYKDPFIEDVKLDADLLDEILDSEEDDDDGWPYSDEDDEEDGLDIDTFDDTDEL